MNFQTKSNAQQLGIAWGPWPGKGRCQAGVNQIPVHSDRAKKLWANLLYTVLLISKPAIAHLKICLTRLVIAAETFVAFLAASFWTRATGLKGRTFGTWRKKVLGISLQNNAKHPLPQNSEVGRSCAPLAPQSHRKPPQKTMVSKKKIWQVGWLGTRAVWSMEETSFDTTNLQSERGLSFPAAAHAVEPMLNRS